MYIFACSFCQDPCQDHVQNGKYRDTYRIVSHVSWYVLYHENVYCYIPNDDTTYFVCCRILLQRAGAAGMDVVAVAAKTWRNQDADASITLTLDSFMILAR